MADEGVRGRNKWGRTDPHGKKAEIFSSVRPGSLAEPAPEVSMERTGVPPEELKNRASGATSLLFSQNALPGDGCVAFADRADWRK